VEAALGAVHAWTIGSARVRTAFKLPLRQTEDLMASILTLMDLTAQAT
jgi:hypothetical protein